MIKYSIILRAYNAEKQIQRSVESIICQKYKNWELIIVDDGSIDYTGKISDDYAKKDERIKVIHQTNSGCVLATQKGIECAKGKYICVLDTDDWYEECYLESINSIVEKENPDMVVTNYNIINPQSENECFSLTKHDLILNREESLKLFFETTNYALWNKVIRKDLIQYEDGEKKFFSLNRKTTNFGEDLYQLISVVCGCEKIYFLSEYLYNYVIDQNSISHQNVSNYWVELKKRNCLMEFVYNSLVRNKCINEHLELLIRRNTIKIMIGSILNILKAKKFDVEVAKELKYSSFYKDFIMNTKKCYIKEWIGSKRMYAFYLFNILIQCLSA